MDDRDMGAAPAFAQRSYYVNFASHLLNEWNVNLIHPHGPNRWSEAEWARFLDMVKAFGFNCFEYWLEPTVYGTALEDPARAEGFASVMRMAAGLAHGRGLSVKALIIPNCVRHEWYFACPNDREDRALIERLWRDWMRRIRGTDIVGLFPGDPGGCNRNGCDHRTFLDLSLSLTEILLRETPGTRVELGTWGTPFSGWGSDLPDVPGWDGTFRDLRARAERARVPGLWNGRPERARAAMEHLLGRLGEFPTDASVAVNLGFSPDADPTCGGDARAWAREIARVRPIASWDYSVTEGELVPHPHFRLPRIFARRREERAAAPYAGAMSYTMTPRLSHLCMYAAGRAAVDPDGDPDGAAREFCTRVFGPQHEALGELMEAFEVVPGWGHYPRRRWSRAEARRAYLSIVEHLEDADMSGCLLPLFPSPQDYRRDLLWFARLLARLSGPDPDRDAVAREYRGRCYAVYESVPRASDERSEEAVKRFAGLFADQGGSGEPPLTGL